MYGSQGFIVQALNADRKASDPKFKKSSYIFFCEVFGVRFKRDFYTFFFIKRKALEYLSCFMVREDRWRSSSEIDSFSREFFIVLFEFEKILSDFFFKVFEVSFFLQIIKNRCESKLTVGTFLTTKRDVDIEVHSSIVLIKKKKSILIHNLYFFLKNALQVGGAFFYFLITCSISKNISSSDWFASMI